MNVAKWVILAVLALPILELAAFIAVVATIGFGWALSLILAGSLQTGAWGGLPLIAGILLLIPGFITDVVALVLLVGSLRRAFVGAPPRQEGGVVDLAPEQWHQVPDPSLPDQHKDERRR
jgi:UPF0716 protein FxsA